MFMRKLHFETAFGTIAILPGWRNWQTRTTQNRVGQPMRVRFSLPAHLIGNRRIRRLCFENEFQYYTQS